jgi:hypothetical protein
MTAEGYAKSSRTMLHSGDAADRPRMSRVVTRPSTTSTQAASWTIEHATCVATNLEQQRNKAARPGDKLTSEALGPVLGGSGFSYTTSDGPQRYRVTGNTEDEVSVVERKR